MSVFAQAASAILPDVGASAAGSVAGTVVGKAANSAAGRLVRTVPDRFRSMMAESAGFSTDRKVNYAVQQLKKTPGGEDFSPPEPPEAPWLAGGDSAEPERKFEGVGKVALMRKGSLPLLRCGPNVQVGTYGAGAWVVQVIVGERTMFLRIPTTLAAKLQHSLHRLPDMPVLIQPMGKFAVLHDGEHMGDLFGDEQPQPPTPTAAASSEYARMRVFLTEYNQPGLLTTLRTPVKNAQEVYDLLMLGVNQLYLSDSQLWSWATSTASCAQGTDAGVLFQAARAAATNNANAAAFEHAFRVLRSLCVRSVVQCVPDGEYVSQVHNLAANLGPSVFPGVNWFMLAAQLLESVVVAKELVNMASSTYVSPYDKQQKLMDLERQLAESDEPLKVTIVLMGFDLDENEPPWFNSQATKLLPTTRRVWCTDLGKNLVLWSNSFASLDPKDTNYLLTEVKSVISTYATTIEKARVMNINGPPDKSWFADQLKFMIERISTTPPSITDTPTTSSLITPVGTYCSFDSKIEFDVSDDNTYDTKMLIGKVTRGSGGLSGQVFVYFSKHSVITPLIRAPRIKYVARVLEQFVIGLWVYTITEYTETLLHKSETTREYDDGWFLHIAFQVFSALAEIAATTSAAHVWSTTSLYLAQNKDVVLYGMDPHFTTPTDELHHIQSPEERYMNVANSQSDVYCASVALMHGFRLIPDETWKLLNYGLLDSEMSTANYLSSLRVTKDADRSLLLLIKTLHPDPSKRLNAKAAAAYARQLSSTYV